MGLWLCWSWLVITSWVQSGLVWFSNLEKAVGLQGANTLWNGSAGMKDFHYPVFSTTPFLFLSYSHIHSLPDPFLNILHSTNSIVFCHRTSVVCPANTEVNIHLLIIYSFILILPYLVVFLIGSEYIKVICPANTELCF